MRFGPRAAWPVLLVAALTAGVRADPPDVHSAATSAVADGRVAKSKLVGFSFARDSFEEVNARGGVLVGFDVGVRKSFDRETVTAYRPIYRTASGSESKGEAFGSFVVERDGLERVVKLRARPGYAVSGARLRTGLEIDAFSLTYCKLGGDRLDPKWAYQSEWVGNVKGGSPGAIDGGAMPAVGVFGNRDRGRVIALGFVHAQLPAPAAPKKKEPPPPAKPKPQDKPAAVKPPAEKPAAPLPARHDALSMELPAGWAVAKHAERPVIKTPLVILSPPEAAYRDAKGRAFVLVRTREAANAGKTLDLIVDETSPPDSPRRESSQVAEVRANEVVVDRLRRRFSWRVTHDVVDGKMETLYVCHAGADSTVTLECMARPEAFGAAVPAFAKVAESSRLDFDKAHREPPGSAPAWLPVAVFVGVSAVIFVPCALVFGLKKKKEPPERRRREIPYAELAPDEPAKPREEEKVPVAELAPQALAPSTGVVSALTQTPMPSLTPPARRGRERDAPADDPFTCVGERTYRVYVLPGEVYFIDDGPGDLAPSRKFGVPDLSLEPEAGAESRPAFGHRPSADDLFALADGVTNFRFKAEDVRQASVELPGYWDDLGAGAVGALKVAHRGLGEMTFRFRGTSDMRRAIELLGAGWPNVSVRARWDATKKAFVRDDRGA